MSDWIQAYGESHQHPVNRACHTVGIPLVTLSILLLLAAPLVPWLWKAGLVLFGVGWFFQFLGHAVEGKPPSSSRTGASSWWGSAGGPSRCRAASLPRPEIRRGEGLSRA